MVKPSRKRQDEAFDLVDLSFESATHRPQPAVFVIDDQHGLETPDTKTPEPSRRPSGETKPYRDDPSSRQGATRSAFVENEVVAEGVPSGQTSPDGKGSVKVTRKWYHPLSLLWIALDNWFLIGIGIVIALASQFPQVMESGGYLKSEYTVQYGSVALIFLITGLTLSTQALLSQFKSFYLHIVTQLFSLVFFPTVIFVIINVIRVANNPAINEYILVGIMVMGVLPTTVASNLTMTRTANGNVEASTAEVVIGQIFGIFLAPLTLLMFLSGDEWAFGQPVASGGQTSTAGLKEIYKQVGQRLGLAVFVPMVVGQIIQNIPTFKTPVKWAIQYLYLNKVSTFMLLTIIWSAFSNQFAQQAFQTIPAQSVILVVFLNLFLYLILTAICLFIVRLPYLPRFITHPPDRPKWRRSLSKFVLSARFAKPEATAVCFCAPAKGLTVGSPILNILYGGFTAEERAIITIPIVLYQGQQVVVAQLLTHLFKRWNAQPDTLVNKNHLDEEGQGLPTVHPERDHEMNDMHD